MDNKKKGKRTLILYGIAFLVIILGFIGVHLYSGQLSAIKHTYEFTPENLNIPQDGLCLTVSISKQWLDDTLHADIPVGAQYDGVLCNRSNRLFHNWSVQLVFSDNTVIDSCWNGDFTALGDQVFFVATGVPAEAQAHSDTTFGAVMYAKELLSLKSYTLTGYSVVRDTDLALYWVLVGAGGLWAVMLLMHLIIHSRTERFRRQRQLDSEIIKQSMNTFTGFIDAKDAYTRGHSARVAAYSAEIARRMKMKPEAVELLYYTTLMHDCGKIGIPDAVLKKPDKLTPEEYRLIQSHTTLGDHILVNFTAIPGIRDGAHYHHERYDGGGYPAGLKGEEIPLNARIICVADSYDAMSSNRCYRPHLTEEAILSELQSNAGKQFDPQIVRYMEEMIRDGFVRKVQAEYPSGLEPTPKKPVTE